MNPKRLLLASLVIVFMHSAFCLSAMAQSAAFTYQGRFTENGAAYSGNAEFVATLWDAASAGNTLASNTPVVVPVTVTNGLFVLPLDFGTSPFSAGADRWLQLEVRTTIAAYTPLTPRQKLTPAPYALTANNLSGTLPATQLSGTVPDARLSANVSLLGTSVESTEITDGTIVNADLSASAAIADTKLATITTAGKVANTALSATVSLLGQTIESTEITDGTIMNVDIAATAAIADSKLATITTAGKVANTALSASVSLLGQTIESAEISDGTIVAADVNAASFGGLFWQVDGNAGTTAGTHFVGTTDNQALELRVNNLRALRLEPNTNSPNVIGGFVGNYVGSAYYGSTIGGGGNLNYSNSVLASYSTIAGGRRNSIGAGADQSAIGGGIENAIAGLAWDSTIAGGGLNDIGASATYSAIGGGYNNNIGDNATYATIAGGQANDIGINSDFGMIGGGYNNNITSNSTYVTIVGGRLNDVGTNSAYSSIGGGYNNNIAADAAYSTIAGGYLNDIGTNSLYATIGGGSDNNIAPSAEYSTIAGGLHHSVGNYSFNSSVGGGNYNGIGDYSDSSTIAGGRINYIQSECQYSVIGGGNGNGIEWSSVAAVIAGGNLNRIGTNSVLSTIVGGQDNVIGTNSFGAFIGGGNGNRIANNADYGTIPGGLVNNATNFAFAAGHRAHAIHTGAFVWGDSTDANVLSVNTNSVTMRASGGYRFFSSADTSSPAPGVQLAAGASAWSVISDRAAKKDIEPVDVTTLLDKLAHVPVFQWHYQWEDGSATPHLGPMAQDFKAAFYPGRDDKSISTLEFDGVALAAIQGLNQKVEEQRAELRRKVTEIADLKQRMERLEQLLNPTRINGKPRNAPPENSPPRP